MQPLSAYEEEDRSTANNTPPTNPHPVDSEMHKFASPPQLAVPAQSKPPSLEALQRNPRKLGRAFTCCYNSDGDPRIVLGPNFGFFICLNLTIWGISLGVFSFAGIKELYLLMTIGIIFLLLQTGIYTGLALSNPGIPSRKYTRLRLQSEGSGSPFNPG